MFNDRKSHDMTLLERSRLQHLYIAQYKEKDLNIFTKMSIVVISTVRDYE